jgi:hypothetical protein
MSAKKVSKMCNFVHKSVKNARFSPRKVQKRGFFAGGRGDFLAGQKRGFLGVRGVARVRCRESRIPFASPHASDGRIATFKQCLKKKKNNYFSAR